MVREDPLVAAGGLMKVSEGGLLEERLRLEEQRHRARMLGGPEGERLEAEVRAKVQEISHHIDDLRASLK